MTGYTIGIDTGGTHTDAAMLDCRRHAIAAKARALTARRDFATGVADAWPSALARRTFEVCSDPPGTKQAGYALRAMRSVAEWALTLLLAGCGASTLAHEARYTGALPGCALTAATLTRLADAFAFAPGDGVLAIRGTVADDGSFSGTLNTQPPTKPAFLLTVRGQIRGERAVLDYYTPRCHDRATLERAHSPLL